MAQPSSSAQPRPLRSRFGLQTGTAIALAFLVLPGAYGSTRSETGDQIETLRRLSIEELAQIEVTSVSRRPEAASRAPASIYVITDEDIRRSGAVNLGEALRLAPNLQVARDITPNYAISARGMNSYATANKLLVLVDGRSIYAPLYAGVLWDEEQVAIETIERIEVISGPGGTLWGANAVNGVINVVTRSAQDSQGWAARVSHGPLERVGILRYGGRLSENGAWRVYLRGFEQDHSLNAAGGANGDEFAGFTGGFRTDWQAGNDHFTLQGDLYENRYGTGAAETRGGNLVGRWTRELDGGASVMVQAYYDGSEREGATVMTESRVGDLAFQHTLAPRGRHEIVWGGGYRYITDLYSSPGGRIRLDPVEDDFQLANIYVQDTIELREDLELTAGLKLEHSTYSGMEYLPSIRLAWRPASEHMLWGAVSRAVRTPVRLDRDAVAPGLLIRGEDFDSESVIAWEAGYRTSLSGRASLSVSVFFNEYEGLRVLSFEPGTTNLPLRFLNGLDGNSWGVEAWGNYQLTGWWRLSAGLSTLEKDFSLRPGLTDLSNPQSTGNDPDYQAVLRSRMDFGSFTFDADLRHVDDLPAPAVPSYTELNARLAWRATDRLEFALTGINLLDESHPETSSSGPPDEIRRSLYLTARLGF